MTCKDRSDPNSSLKLLNLQQGPTAITTNYYGYNFSTEAIADLRRRGYSFDFINSLTATNQYQHVRDTAEGIRNIKPRTIQLSPAVNPDKQKVLDAYLQRIAAANQDIIENNKAIEATKQHIAKAKAAGDSALVESLTNKLNGTLQYSRNKILRSMKANSPRIKSLFAQDKNHPINNIFGETARGVDMVLNSDADGKIAENALNCYMDVQYHISLTMLSEPTLKRYQTEGYTFNTREIDINELKQTKQNSEEIVIASTGDNFTTKAQNVDVPDTSMDFVGMDVVPNPYTQGGASIHQTNNYYNIISMSLNNIVEPSIANPMISSMIGIKMKVAEPVGFQLHEDIKDTAVRLGYKDINTGRIGYRIDIYFSGYDQETGEWIEQINIGKKNEGFHTISYIVSLTNMVAEITSSGSQYELDFAPISNAAIRPEDFTMDAGVISSGVTFGDFLENISQSLNSAKRSRTQNRIEREYEFILPSELAASRFDAVAFLHQEKMIYESNGDKIHTITSAKSMDIMSILNGAMKNVNLAVEAFNADNNNDAFLKPRVIYVVRFNSIYVETDKALHDYRKIVHQYIIEPLITYKHGPVTPQNIDIYVDPTNQLSRVKKMIQLGMIRRVYSYINTSDNNDVINFNINLRTFYYNTLNNSTMGQDVRGVSNSATASDIKKQTSSIADLFRLHDNSKADFRNMSNTMRRMFGVFKSQYTPSVMDGATRLGGGFNETPSTMFTVDTTSASNGPRGNYEAYMRDYLSMDLLRLNNMTIRGDPTWMLSPYGNADMNNISIDIKSVRIGKVSSDSNITVRPRSGQVIFLKMFAPVQDDYLDPKRQLASSSPNIIGGFYQIYSIMSSFEGGKFTQTIDGVKLNHLNYVEDLFEREIPA